MIYFPLLGKMGRLGNQLFQVAAAIAHAERNKTKAIIPAWPYGRCFAGPWNHSPSLPPLIPPTYKEPSYNHSQLPATDSLILEGYFQSYKYFEDQEAVVRKALNWKGNIVSEEKRLIVTELGHIHVAMHVRRGDFLQYPTKFPVLHEEYYVRALRQVLDIAVNIYADPSKHKIRIHVFSDDPEYCKNTYPLNGKGFEWHFHEGNTEIEDLYLMTLCDHFIIANSSFSWWGAWLSRNTNKVVVSPPHSEWFGPENGFFGQTQDLLPPTWKQIDF